MMTLSGFQISMGAALAVIITLGWVVHNCAGAAIIREALSSETLRSQGDVLYRPSRKAGSSALTITLDPQRIAPANSEDASLAGC